MAGVQLKFSALLEATGGLTIPVTGSGGSWIVKLPSVAYSDLPENEFAMLKFARAIGITVPEHRLISIEEIQNLPSDIPVGFGRAFAVERFDRMPDGRRLHIEDFAQVFNLYPVDKYDKVSYRNMAEVLNNECDEESVVQFISRLVFSIAIGNADMHLKNWSLLYTDPSKPTLAPAYDLVSTIVYIPEDPKLALNLGGSKEMYKIHADHFKSLASKARLPESLVVMAVNSTVERIHEAWPDIKDSFPQKLLPMLQGHMDKVPILKMKRFPKSQNRRLQQKKGAILDINKSSSSSERPKVSDIARNEFNTALSELYALRSNITVVADELDWKE
ncbi:HipA domain-containing protein, partial [bacterium]|nr:HipA domain-containing protein [bacterium]